MDALDDVGMVELVQDGHFPQRGGRDALVLDMQPNLLQRNDISSVLVFSLEDLAERAFTSRLFLESNVPRGEHPDFRNWYRGARS